MSNEYLWVEKYRPQTIDDTILPKKLKQTFQKIVEGGELPNMLFTCLLYTSPSPRDEL